MSGAKENSLDDVRLVELNQAFTEEQGAIVFCEESNAVPFIPKRVYYLYDVPNQAERGGHAHKALKQIMVAVSGSFEVVINDGNAEKTIRLDQPNQGLYFPPGLWRELRGFSGGAICLVLASEEYLESDYIRSKQVFATWRKDKL